MKKSPILGYYGYWVVLTYLAVISAMAGICLAISGRVGTAVICLVISGICDMFDGAVARTATRNDMQKAFGIQIDSLADVISFGVLPAAIGFGIYNRSEVRSTAALIAIALIGGFYVLAALIRLAYFNVTEEELKSKGHKRIYYEGLPVTSSSLILSVTYALCGSMEQGLCWIYNGLLLLLGSAFILKFRMPKFKLIYMVILSFVGLGVIITALILRGVL
jgi:CDP-diacylglycerol--serine O-phosphatidyltransferase